MTREELIEAGRAPASISYPHGKLAAANMLEEFGLTPNKSVALPRGSWPGKEPMDKTGDLLGSTEWGAVVYLYNSGGFLWIYEYIVL